MLFLFSLCVASPIHVNKKLDERHEIEIPNDVLASLCTPLEKLVSDNHITIEMANNILVTKKLPVELAQYFGLWAHSGLNGFDLLSQQLQGNATIPINFNRAFYGGCSSSGFNSPNVGATSPIHHIAGITGVSNSQSFTNFTGNSNSASQSPIHYNISGTSSPNPYLNAASVSPMHQITKGISGLTTGGGSITRGTSAASESASNQPLDLTMDASSENSNNANAWYVPAQFYDLKPLNLSPAQPVRIVPTPPASPNLCIIQEEHPHILYQPDSINGNALVPLNADDSNTLHSHPQISVTDVQGSEVTLVALSDNSHDSEDSLDAQSSMTMQGLIITEPSSDMPSITRGVGRKSSLEIENRQDTYERRGSDKSDKSLGFSDDSLSNDSNIVSPGHEPSAASSGFKSGCDSEITEARLSPDSLSDSRRMSEECYELPLPHECSDLDSSRIIEIVKQTIDSKMPPKCFILHKMDSVMETGNSGAIGTGSDVPFSLDISNLSLEYSGGLQIELQVYGGKCKDSCNKGIKLRRISGDQFEYGKLCQQLISSLAV